MNWQFISTQITEATGTAFNMMNARAITGGDINIAYHLQGEQQAYFVKLNRAELITMFEAEACGLNELADSNTLRVPKPITYGISADKAYLVLEYIEFSRRSSSSDRLLGQKLALLHNQPKNYFGWQQDNTIGSTPQSNRRHTNWPDFWRDERLHHQLHLAATKGYRGHLQTAGEQLCGHLPDFFSDYQPQPSLLHGDLWSGNAATDSSGQPVIFDPACYYGDRETDVAMTELFGGFSQDFYAAYADINPLHAGYKIRKKLYNIYHILNHLNLFGSGYLRQAENMISELLSEIN